MPLNINPRIRLRSPDASRSLIGNTPSNQSATLFNNTVDFSKLDLDETLSRLSASTGSALNGATSSRSVSSALPQLIQNNVSLSQFPRASPAQVINRTAPAFQSPSEVIASSTLSTVARPIATSDIIQQSRTRNIPDVSISPIVPAQSGGRVVPDTVVNPVSADPGDWRVKISAPLEFGRIIFPVLPIMTLAHTADYTDTAIVHSNYHFLAYKSSKTEDIIIECKWPVETLSDARAWLDMVRLGRTLTKMFYGTGEYLGNPPPICTLSGYSASPETGTVLPSTPVVVKSFSFTLADDVDYLSTDGQYVPRLSSVSITVSVVYNRNSQRAFSLGNYRTGRTASNSPRY